MLNDLFIQSLSGYGCVPFQHRMFAGCRHRIQYLEAEADIAQFFHGLHLDIEAAGGRDVEDIAQGMQCEATVIPQDERRA